MSQIGINDLNQFVQNTPSVADKVNENFAVIKAAHNETDTRLGEAEEAITIKADASDLTALESSHGTTTLTTSSQVTRTAINEIEAKTIKFGTSSTASATAEKAVTATGLTLTKGAVALIVFTNANTAAVPTLNVNSLGAKAIYSEDGTQVSATNPAYFPAGCKIEFVYDGTYWIFKRRIVDSYVNGTTWRRKYSDGFMEQGVTATYANNATIAVTFPTQFTIVCLSVLTNFQPTGSQSAAARSITTTGFTLYCNGGVVNWEARGY